MLSVHVPRQADRCWLLLAAGVLGLLQAGDSWLLSVSWPLLLTRNPAHTAATQWAEQRRAWQILGMQPQVASQCSSCIIQHLLKRRMQLGMITIVAGSLVTFDQMSQANCKEMLYEAAPVSSSRRALPAFSMCLLVLLMRSSSLCLSPGCLSSRRGGPPLAS